MTWLTDHHPVPAGRRFRERLSHPGIFRLPGAHNGRAALQARAAGFKGLYLSGAPKIAAAVRARRELGVIARTDAVANEGLEAAISRARLYLQAGADAIFPEALTDISMLRAFADALPGVPLLANMTEFGRTPYLIGAELEELGYKVVI